MPDPSNRFPLVEAIFELQVADSPGWSQLSQKTLLQQFNAVFDGDVDQIEPFEMQFGMGPEGVAQQVSKRPPRTRVWAAARREMVQFDQQLCAYNILEGYSRFEDHLPRLKDTAERYLAEVRPTALEWVGQRYINRLELSAEGSNPADVLTFYPTLPTGAQHRPFAMQVVADGFDDGDVVVSLSFQGLKAEKALYFLEFNVRSKSPVASSADAVVAWHIKAHEPVRRAFAMAVTQQALSSFKRQP